MLRLPETHRDLFKKPFGTLYGSIGELLPRLSGRAVYAVGDGSNDVPMFRVVGNPVAVGRRPEILALEEEGVPRFDGVLEALAYVAERIGE